MTVTRAVNGAGGALHGMVPVDALHGMSAGGAVDGPEFQEIAPVSILSVHLLGEGEESGIVRSGKKVSLLSLSWFVMGMWWERKMGGKAQSISRVRQFGAKNWSRIGVVGVGWQRR
jgi:hypothetical protein